MYKHLITYAIGGLENVGFIDGGDRLLVLSSQGIGIFDCTTGNKIYRDNNDWWRLYNENENIVNFEWEGRQHKVQINGLVGNTNTLVTNDNWELTLSNPVPDNPPFDKCEVQQVLLNNKLTSEVIIIAKDGPCEHRAFGFSTTGNSLISALGCELVIWTNTSAANDR